MTNRRNSPFIRKQTERFKQLLGQGTVYPIMLGPNHFGYLVDRTPEGFGPQFIPFVPPPPPPPFVPPSAPSFGKAKGYWTFDNFDLGSVLDVTGLNDGVNVNALTGETGQIQEAFFFDGASSYIIIPSDISLESHIGASGQFSLSAWVNVAQDDYETVVLASSPVAFWRLEEPSGTVMADSTGNGYTLELTNNLARTIPGLLTSGSERAIIISTSGTNYGRILAPFSGLNGATEVTVEGWFLTDQVGGTRTWFDLYTSSNTEEFTLKYTAATTFEYTVRGSTSTFTSPTLTDDNPHHLVFKWRSSDGAVAFWLDGVSQGSTTGVATGQSITNDGAIHLGANSFNGTTASEKFQGVVDEWAVYNTYLSDAEIANHHAVGTATTSPFTVASKYDSDNNERAWSFEITATNKLRFEASDLTGANFDSKVTNDSLVSGWTHVGVVWDNAQVGIENKALLYIDGYVADGAQDTSGGAFAEMSGSSADVLLGAINPPVPANFLDGYMDEAIIFNEAITDDNMLVLFALGSDGYRYVDPIADPASYWTLDDADLSGTTVLDVVGSNDGINTGGSTTGVAGVVGETFDFNGTTQSVEVADDPTLDFTTGVGVSAWFKLDTRTGHTFKTVVRKATPTHAGALSDWTINFDSTNDTLFFSTKDSFATPNPTNSIDTIQTDAWYHITGYWDGYVQKLFLDGEEKDSTIWTGTLQTSNGSLWMGQSAPTSSHYWDGNIDEVAVWDTGLRDEDAQILYNYGVPNIPSPVFALGFDDADTSGSILVDKSHRGNDGTIVGGVTTSNAGQVNQSYDFNGTGHINHGDLADLDFTTATPFSISFWYNAVSFATTTNPVVLSKYNFAVGSGWQCAMQPVSGDDYFALGLATSTYTVGRIVRTTAVPPSGGTWHHALVTYDGSNTVAGIKWYIDGVSVATTTITDTDPGDITNSDDVLTGANLNSSVPSTFWEDSLDELYVFTEELDARQIAFIYAEGAKGRTLL